MPLDPLHIRALRDRAFREIYRYVVRNGLTLADIEAQTIQFSLILKHPYASRYVGEFKKLLAALESYVNGFSFDDPLRQPIGDTEKQVSTASMVHSNLVVKDTEGGNIKHVSAGVLVVNNGRLLLIRKKQAPYADLLSIPAGHVEIGESAREALCREVREELGITLTQYDLVHHWDGISGDLCRYGAHCHEWFVYISDQAVASDQIKLDAEEAVAFEWHRLEDLPPKDQLTFAARFILQELRLL